MPPAPRATRYEPFQKGFGLSISKGRDHPAIPTLPFSPFVTIDTVSRSKNKVNSVRINPVLALEHNVAFPAALCWKLRKSGEPGVSRLDLLFPFSVGQWLVRICAFYHNGKMINLQETVACYA